MKKIFSLNLISYLQLKGHKVTGLGYDEQSKKVYYMFEQTPEVKTDIEQYKKVDTTVNLHEFVQAFKDVKLKMHIYQKEKAGA